MADEPQCEQGSAKPSLGWETSVRYYLEGIPKTANLLELDVSKNLFLGHLQGLVDSAKRALREISGEDILIILSFGDWHISGLIEDGFQVRVQDGSSVALTCGLLDRIVRTDMMRVTLKFLGENEFSIKRSRESNDPPLLISPARFCAACALADMHRALFFCPLEDHWSDIAGFHALQVAETVAMMKMLNREDPLNAPTVEREIFSKRAREGAAARLANDVDGKQAAKREVFALWKEWKKGKLPKIRTVEQFAIEALRRHPRLTNLSTIRNWSAKWNRELKSERGNPAS